MKRGQLILWVFFSLCAFSSQDAFAAGLGRALRELAQALAKQSDELAAGVGQGLRQLGRGSDEALEKVGRSLADKGVPPLEQVLRQANVDVNNPAVRQLVDSLDDSTKQALAGFVDTFRSSLQRLPGSDLKLPDLLEAVEKGGPDSVLVLRTMQTNQGVHAAIRGYKRLGSQFTDFAKKADEPGIKFLDEHWEAIRQLDEAKRADLFQNPHKYITPGGKPTAEFDNIFKSISTPKPRATVWGRLRKAWKKATTLLAAGGGLGIILGTVAFFVHLPDFVFALLPEWLTQWLPESLWGRWIVLMLLALALYLGGARLLVAAFWWALEGLFKLLPLQWARRLATNLENRRKRPRPITLKKPQSEKVLRLGLLGISRVGKTTFIVMLTEKLGVLRPGASLSPLREAPDAKLLRRIKQEAARCQSTTQDKTIRFDLVWPYEDKEKEDDQAEAPEPSQAAGKSNTELVLMDFPGEWAHPDASPQDRQKLIEYLEKVDGLFLVIDPTEYWAQGQQAEDRFRLQEEAIEGLFRQDGLDLSRRFHRAMAVIITKRDMLTPEHLEQLAQRPDGPGPQHLDRMKQLIAKPTLTAAESQELGQWLLKALFPRQNWSMRMAAEEPPKRSWWYKLLPWNWFSLPGKEQLAVFAVTQLGPELGKQVVQYLHQRRQWESQGRKGPEPEIELDFRAADSSKLEFHLPFAWMFDNIPEALLHEVNSSRSNWEKPLHWYRIYRRFPGNPVVRKHRNICRAALATTVTAIFIFVTLFVPWISRLQIQQEARILITDLSNTHNPRKVARIEQEMRVLLPRLTAPYSDAIRLALRWIKTENQMREKEREIFATESPSLEAIFAWLDLHKRLDPPKENWLPELLPLREKYDRRLHEIIDELEKSCRNLVDRAEKPEDFNEVRQKLDRAKARVDSLVVTLEQTSDRRQRFLNSEIPLLKETLSGKHADYLAEQALKEAKKEERFREAIRICDEALRSLEEFSSNASEARREIRIRRSDFLKQYFRQIKSQIEDLRDKGEIEKARQLCLEFERVPDPNPHREDIGRIRRNLSPDWVARVIEEARSKQNHQEALQHLQKAKTALRTIASQHPQLVEQWYEEAVRRYMIQEKYEEAALLLEEPLAQQEAWANPLREKVYTRWAQRISRQNINQLQKIEDLLKLQAEIDDVLRKAKNLPSSLKERLRAIKTKIEKRIPILKWDEKFKKVQMLIAPNPLQALGQLIQLIGSAKNEDQRQRARDAYRDAFRNALPQGKQPAAKKIADLQNLRRFVNKDYLSDELIDQWLEMLVDALCQGSRYKEAFQEAKNAHDKKWISQTEKYDEKISQLFVQQCQNEISELRQKQQWHQLSIQLANWREMIYDKANYRFSEKYQRQFDQLLEETINQRLRVLEKARTDIAENIRGQLRLVQEAKQQLAPLFGNLQGTKHENLKQLLENMEEKIQQDILQNEFNEWVQKTRRATHPEDFKRVLQGIDIVLQRKDLPDKFRREYERLKQSVSVQFEKYMYQQIKDARFRYEFQKMANLAKEYLDLEPMFFNNVNDRHKNAVQGLKNWFNRFKKRARYTLEAVHCGPWPDPWGSNFDPRIQVTLPDGRHVRLWEDNVEGNVAIKNIQGNRTFQWRVGDRIDIQVCEDYYANAEYLIGIITVNDPYALLRLHYADKGSNTVFLQVKKGDYADYFDKDIELRFEIGEIKQNPLPRLPD